MTLEANIGRLVAPDHQVMVIRALGPGVDLPGNGEEGTLEPCPGIGADLVDAVVDVVDPPSGPVVGCCPTCLKTFTREAADAALKPTSASTATIVQ